MTSILSGAVNDTELPRFTRKGFVSSNTCRVLNSTVACCTQQSWLAKMKQGQVG